MASTQVTSDALEVDESRNDRRAVLGKIASAIFAGLVAPALLGADAAKAQSEAAEGPRLPTLPDPEPGEDPLVRMLRDLQRALAKPPKERRWVMVIDLR